MNKSQTFYSTLSAECISSADPEDPERPMYWKLKSIDNSYIHSKPGCWGCTYSYCVISNFTLAYYINPKNM